MRFTPRIVFPILLSVVFVGVLILFIRWFEFESIMMDLLVLAQAAGFPGQLLVVLLGAVSVVAIIPSVVLTLAAGFLYGAFHGSVLIVVGETCGSVLAFAIARTGLVQSWTARIRNSGSLKVVNLIMSISGWELVAAIRMIPFFPFKLSNYLFGLSPVTVRDYIVGTMVGLWPITLFNTYLGSMAGDLMSLGMTERPRTLGEWLLITSGFMIVVVFMLYALARSQRLLKEHQGGNAE